MAAKDTIIWLGTIADDDRVLQSAAASPAANRWQRGLVSALAGTGISIRIVGHWPEPVFPKGPLFVGKKKDFACKILGAVEQTWVSYFNVPHGRTKMLEIQYARAVRDMVFGHSDRLLGVVTYNAINIGRKIKNNSLCGARIPWVPIIADADGSPEGRERLFRETSTADAVVALSWGLAGRWCTCPVLHLDGGVAPKHVFSGGAALCARRTVFPFLYCGAINKWAGVDRLVDAFAGWSEPRARLWICGKGAVPERFFTLMHDQRVKCFGAVTSDQLDALAAECYALVNPRRTDLCDNQMNFPSKVLEYLRYGKPVISTWTEGLSPEYRSVLSVTRDGSASALRDAMADAVTWPEETLQKFRQSAEVFLAGRTWEAQAQRLRVFLEHLSDRGNRD